MVTGHRLSRVGFLVICLAVVGCADPDGERASRTATPQSGATAGAALRNQRSAGDARVPEPLPAPPVDESVLPPGSESRAPGSLARWYAREVVNWDWRTLARRLERLRARSAGRLAVELDDAIRGARRDESLARDRPASQGRVVAVSVQGTGASRVLVVVTRERETASGVEPLGPATHSVYIGTARRFADEWRMVAWRRAP